MANSKSRIRLDQLLLEQGLASTRSKAQALILSGDVLVNDTPVTKAGANVPSDAAVRVRGQEHPYVSRAALKLKSALETFGVNPEGKICLDVGASTGGFTQILLLAGAAKVYAVDVGHSQMDYQIRRDPRVVCLEKVNARSMSFDTLGEPAEVIVVDVSFISLTKILPALLQFFAPATDLITLIKPQFEVGREKIEKGGIVRDSFAAAEAVSTVTSSGETLGLRRLALIDSPIRGSHGNQEYLAHWRRAD